MGNALTDKVYLYYPPLPGDEGVVNMSDDAYGNLFAVRHARDMGTTSKEITTSISENRKVTRKFKVRYDLDITEDMKLVCRGIPYDIKGISEDAERTFMYLICERGV